jgi:predicted phosphodiesterase
MRYLIISDIHANLTAFETVLQDAGEFDMAWCLGDMVGYGPDPNECVALLRKNKHVCLAGNHDWAALGKLDLRGFNADARKASEWTQAQLRPAARNYLQGLQPQRVEQEKYTLAHGSPRQPIWEYILDALTAEFNFLAFTTSVCFVGHTHIPVLYQLPFEPNDHHPCSVIAPDYGNPVDLSAGRWIINPGSVGQPRDGNPSAAYGILDLDANTFEHRRVKYDIQATQERMRQSSLPPRLIERLTIGH